MNIARFFRTALAVSALFVGLIHTAKADLVTYTGDTTGGPTYNRPWADFSDLSETGTNVAYRMLGITVDTSGDYSFVASGLQFDTLLFLYEGSFDAGSPLINGLEGSDDLVSTNTSGFSAMLDANTNYVLVITGFTNDDAGQYAITIAGPGVISAVPEPSAWLMLAIGLAAVGYTRRRKLN